jgi:hypothetical protein
MQLSRLLSFTVVAALSGWAIAAPISIDEAESIDGEFLLTTASGPPY